MGLINCKYCIAYFSLMPRKKNERKENTAPHTLTPTRLYLRGKLKTCKPPVCNSTSSGKPKRKVTSSGSSIGKPAKRTWIVPEVVLTDLLKEIGSPGSPGEFSLTDTGQLEFTPAQLRQKRLMMFQGTYNSPWGPYTAQV
jgi:hypothetical protein